MSTGEDFALSKSVRFGGFYFGFFFLVLLNLLVKISIFAMEVPLVQIYKWHFACSTWKRLTSEIGSSVIW